MRQGLCVGRGKAHGRYLAISLSALRARILTTRRALALAYKGDTTTARAECEEALRRSKERLGPDHPVTLGLTEEPGVSRTGDFGFSYAARWFSNHSHSTSLGVIYPKAE